MSVALMSWVFTSSQTTGSDRLVLLAIADNANDDGSAWPSIPTIATKARVSERTAQRSIASLEALGELKVVKTKGGRKSTNVYVVVTDGSKERCQIVTVLEPADLNGDTDDTANGDTYGTPSGDTGVTRTISGTIKGTTMVPRTRGKRSPAPESFTVGDDLRAWMKDHHLYVEDLDHETERFLNWYRQHGKELKDWTAGWKNWIIKAAKIEAAKPAERAWDYRWPEAWR